MAAPAVVAAWRNQENRGDMMENHIVAKWKAYLLMGVAGILLAAGYLWEAFQLPFGQPDQPGAGLFPVVVGVILLCASVATVWEGWRMERSGNDMEFPAGADLYRLLKLIAYLFGYFLLLPVLGFPAASFLFCLVLIHALSSLSWLRCTLYGILMSAASSYLFIHMLNVPLPRGMLNI